MSNPKKKTDKKNLKEISVRMEPKLPSKEELDIRYKLSTAEFKILETLCKSPHQLKIYEVVAKSGVSYNYAGRVLQVLSSRGFVKRHTARDGKVFNSATEDGEFAIFRFEDAKIDACLDKAEKRVSDYKKSEEFTKKKGVKNVKN